MAPRWKRVARKPPPERHRPMPRFREGGVSSSGLGMGKSASGAIGGGMLAATKADEHLDDAGQLVLRAGDGFGCEAASHAEDVDGSGAFHRGALGDAEEVVAVPAGASGAALGERERDRRGVPPPRARSVATDVTATHRSRRER